MLIAILLSLLKPFPMFGEQLTELPPILSEGEMRYYSDLEIELLIDEISEAALEAIELAAGEAAKAAVLAMAEREASALQAQALALREMQRWKNEAEMQSLENSQIKKAVTKNIIVAALICFLGGFAIGVGGTIAISK